MVEMKPVKALLHAPQGALHTAQPCFIFCGIAAKCFINPPLRRLCRKVYGLLRTFTDTYRQEGHKEICLYLSVAKHKLCFSAYFVDRVDQLDQMDSKKVKLSILSIGSIRSIGSFYSFDNRCCSVSFKSSFSVLGISTYSCHKPSKTLFC